ncbi:MAG TPA: YlqD family protein [Armatimonadota bacterium]|nr:YlqD family protein [Armatimonadota bacterium]
MNSITLKRGVTLIAIVTEEFKEQLAAEIQAAIDEVDSTVEQLDSQSRRYLLELQRTNLQQAMALRQRVDEERQKHASVRAELTRQLEDVGKLEIASEFRRGTLEGVVEVSVGDNLMQLLNGAELVMKDGVVQELRYARALELIDSMQPALDLETESAG